MKAQRFLLSVQQQLNTSPNDQEKYEHIIRQFFRRYFSPDQSANISDLKVIESIALESGLDSKVIHNAINAIGCESVKEQLRTNTQKALDLGGFGLPITTIHLPSGKQFVFGSDRMHIIGHLLGESNPPVLR